ncbi:hypothetical protein V6N13_102615 [Hibiscus sabdariffa]|uniref:AP complex mu/sigma subunit domain-containing protein n=1 Tax=Hibiscus sabdariffa TaxID=183260 RepID=A0ABR2D4N0_9ROSI
MDEVEAKSDLLVRFWWRLLKVLHFPFLCRAFCLLWLHFACAIFSVVVSIELFLRSIFLIVASYCNAQRHQKSESGIPAPAFELPENPDFPFWRLFWLLSRMIHFVLLISRQGKVRLTKWYSPYSQKERTKVIRELGGVILSRGPKLCNFVDWRGFKVAYKRYASLYFCMCIDQDDNELEVLEIIHHFVEILDRYFGSVCELDLIFNFHKAYYILDELLLAGELQESSKKTVARLIAAQDSLVETAKEQASSISNIIAQATK